MFDHFPGQSRITALLSAAMKRDEVAHAYLFVGTSGQEEMAEAFARALLCNAAMDQRPCGVCAACKTFENGNAADFIHIRPEEGTQNIKIRQVREIINAVARRTFDGGMRICLITQAEKMTQEAQNALLKSLEEPSPGTVFLLTAQRGEGVLPTIRSRCQVMTLSEQERNDVQLDPETKAQTVALMTSFFSNRPYTLFAFSEALGKDKKTSEAVTKTLIIAFEEAFRQEKTRENIHSNSSEPKEEQLKDLLNRHLKTGQSEQILEVLFEFLSRMQYNVNLRLQWESVLLKIEEIINE